MTLSAHSVQAIRASPGSLLGWLSEARPSLRAQSRAALEELPASRL